MNTMLSKKKETGAVEKTVAKREKNIVAPLMTLTQSFMRGKKSIEPGAQHHLTEV